MSARPVLLLSFLAACIAGAVSAQTQLTATVTPARPDVRDKMDVSYTFNAPMKKLTPPDFAGFRLVGGPQQSQSYSIKMEGNKTVSSMSCRLTYTLQAKDTGHYTILPARATDTSGREYYGDTLQVEVIRKVHYEPASTPRSRKDYNRLTDGFQASGYPFMLSFGPVYGEQTFGDKDFSEQAASGRQLAVAISRKTPALYLDTYQMSGMPFAFDDDSLFADAFWGNMPRSFIAVMDTTGLRSLAAPVAVGDKGQRYDISFCPAADWNVLTETMHLMNLHTFYQGMANVFRLALQAKLAIDAEQLVTFHFQFGQKKQARSFAKLAGNKAYRTTVTKKVVGSDTVFMVQVSAKILLNRQVLEDRGLLLLTAAESDKGTYSFVQVQRL